jgi:hypothetical protein
MEKLYKKGEAINTLPNVGDIIEIDNGIFVKVKSVDEILVESLGGIKKTSIKIKTEIIANE